MAGNGASADGYFALQSSREQRGLHVAVIMDGNGRWAARRGLPRVAGHRAGVAAVRRVVERAPELGIETLTVYAFSSDNWRRPAFEVRSILSLIGGYLRLERSTLREAGVRVEAIGRRDRLPRILLREIAQCEAATAGGGGLHLRVAVDYSSREAMARAAARAFAGVGPWASDAEQFPSPDAARRAMAEVLREEGGDVDLLIRTGGEKRLSDFLLWESAYAELVFTDVMWPEFGAAELDAAVEEFLGRERRFGGVVERIENAASPQRGWVYPVEAPTHLIEPTQVEGGLAGGTADLGGGR